MAAGTDAIGRGPGHGPIGRPVGGRWALGGVVAGRQAVAT
jgi:hypothetical protein